MPRPSCPCKYRNDICCDANGCELAPAGMAFDPAGMCRACWLYWHDPIFNVRWGGDGQVKMTSKGSLPPPSPCIHLGQATGEEVPCPVCPSGGGENRIPLLACAVHGVTTGKRGAPGQRSCHGCPDHFVSDPFGGAVVRNLLMHVYPVHGNGVWQRVVAMMLRRIGLFNGRRVVAILTGKPGEAVDPPERVREAFAGQVHEFILMENDPGLREVQTYAELFGRVETASPRQVTLYCHAKGVTRPAEHTAHEWTRLLVETCCDYWPWVERLLRQHPCAAPFVRYIKGWPESSSEWHPSGSWWWFRNKDWFSHADWATRIDRFWSGIEGIASNLFPAEQCGQVFFTFHRPGPGLYDPDFFAGEVLPAYQAWQAEHRQDRKEW